MARACGGRPLARGYSARQAARAQRGPPAARSGLHVARARALVAPPGSRRLTSSPRLERSLPYVAAAEPSLPARTGGASDTRGAGRRARGFCLRRAQCAQGAGALAPRSSDSGRTVAGRTEASLDARKPEARLPDASVVARASRWPAPCRSCQLSEARQRCDCPPSAIPHAQVYVFARRSCCASRVRPRAAKARVRLAMRVARGYCCTRWGGCESRGYPRACVRVAATRKSVGARAYASRHSAAPSPPREEQLSSSGRRRRVHGDPVAAQGATRRLRVSWFRSGGYSCAAVARLCMAQRVCRALLSRVAAIAISPPSLSLVHSHLPSARARGAARATGVRQAVNGARECERGRTHPHCAAARR